MLLGQGIVKLPMHYFLCPPHGHLPCWDIGRRKDGGLYGYALQGGTARNDLKEGGVYSPLQPPFSFVYFSLHTLHTIVNPFEEQAWQSGGHAAMYNVTTWVEYDATGLWTYG